MVYDLSDPTHPQLASRTTGPFQTYSYWGFFCGVGLWGGYWFGNGENTVITDAGLAQVRMDYQTDGAKAVTLSQSPRRGVAHSPTGPCRGCANDCQ